MNIPFYNVDRIYKNYKAEIDQTVQKSFLHGQVLAGPEVVAFEEQIAKRCRRKFAVAVGSCTDALFFSLVSAGIKEGDEVLVTGYTFVASVSCILRARALPVFVDINCDTYLMDLDDLKSKITKKTKAILAVHMFGQSLAMDQVEKIAKDYNLILLEDAAQALGAVYQNRPAGSLGLSSSISFDPTKIVGAFGNGGVLLTDSEQVAEAARRLRYHGKDSATGEFVSLGYNSRLATSQAALLLLQLQWLDGWIAQRQKIVNRYMNELSTTGDITMPVIQPGSNHIFHKFVIKTDKRNGLQEFLKKNGVATMVHYSKGLNKCPLIEGRPASQELKNIDQVSNQVISLPIYPELTDQEINYIIDQVKSFFR